MAEDWEARRKALVKAHTGFLEAEGIAEGVAKTYALKAITGKEEERPFNETLAKCRMAEAATWKEAAQRLAAALSGPV